MDTNTSNINEVLAVEKLKEKLYSDINVSGLSIVSVYYIMKDIMNEVIAIYNGELKKLKEQEESTKTVEDEAE